MAEPIHDIDAAKVAANLEEVRAVTGDRVELLVVKREGLLAKHVLVAFECTASELGVRAVARPNHHEIYTRIIQHFFSARHRTRKSKALADIMRRDP